jgi:hypothetical protein
VGWPRRIQGLAGGLKQQILHCAGGAAEFAQMLLDARCALINGELGKYTGWSPTDSSLEQAVAA